MNSSHQYSHTVISTSALFPCTSIDIDLMTHNGVAVVHLGLLCASAGRGKLRALLTGKSIIPYSGNIKPKSA